MALAAAVRPSILPFSPLFGMSVVISLVGEGITYTLGLFLWTGLGFALSSLATPASNSRFNPAFALGSPSFALLSDDSESSVPFADCDASLSDLMSVEDLEPAFGSGFDLSEGDSFWSFDSMVGEVWRNCERCSDDRLSRTIRLGLDTLLTFGEEVFGGVETLESELGALGCFGMVGIVCDV